jgi:pyrrolysyl-tRNA synthetase-like protein
MQTTAWSASQKERLRQLNADENQLRMVFQNSAERNEAYQQIEKTLVQIERDRLNDYFIAKRRPRSVRLEHRLAEALTQDGFVQVTTPIIMSRGHLARMAIDRSHCLSSQVFWIGQNRCLRPMLAPHLYYILKDLLRLCERPVRIFEIGPCFRKESHGRQHLSEFTMLNLVEMGLPVGHCSPRLNQLADRIMRVAGIDNFKFVEEPSSVYGQTIDVVSGADEIELGSGAMGPHPLDHAWGISEAWVGIGFGLERLLTAADPDGNISKFGRSLAYLDGIRLNI